ncbi:MAG: hypothetical protein V3T14_00095, partial [Myxococcota bacterium]
CTGFGTCQADSRIGRCNSGARVCDPLREKTKFNPSGIFDDCPINGDVCRFCGGRYFVNTDNPLFVANTCDPASARCTLTPERKCVADADCGQFETPQRGASATGLAAVLGLQTPPENPLALPVGYDNGGVETLELPGRISGINALTYDVRVPLLVITTTGNVSMEFRDNNKLNVTDSQDLGVTLGGGLGVGAGGMFMNPMDFPAGGSCCDTGANISWAPENLGFPATSSCEGGDPCETDADCFGDQGSCLPDLALAIAWGPGPNKLPGCVKDNDPASNTDADPSCNNPLGLTGLDAEAAVGTPCGGGKASGVLADGRCNTGFDDPRITVLIGGVQQFGLAARRKVPNPNATAPTLPSVGAGTARDINVLGIFNADALFKTDGLGCPIGTDGRPSCCIDGTEPSCESGPGQDSDGDGVLDFNGPACPTGQTQGCSDNCQFQPNNTDGNVQRDSNSDGVGDSCDCGNTDESQAVDIFDALNIAQATLTPPQATMNNPRACDSDGSGGCDIFDALRVAQATLTPPQATILDECPAFAGPAPGL